jgi:hypothetical protein
MKSARVDQKNKPVEQQPDRPKSQSQQDRSPFKQVIQQGRIMHQQPSMQQQLSKHVIEHKTREEHKERNTDKREQKRTHRDGDKAVEKDHGRKAEKQDSGPQHRTVVKTSQQRDGRGGQQGSDSGNRGGGEGRGGTGQQARTSEQSAKYASTKSDLGTAVASKFQQQMMQEKAAQLTMNRSQMQQLVNLLVQSIRLGKNEVGAEELEMSFQAHVFKGLRLRLLEKNGKIAVSFLSSDGGVRALFQRESDRIRKALKHKGVDVEAIEVLR